MSNKAEKAVHIRTLRAFESLNGRNVDGAVAKDILPRLEKQGVVPQKSK